MFKLSLEALLIIDAIDRTGSFSAAAKELHRVPSTISYTVAKLEDDLGVQVFERAGPKIKLTPAGRELLSEGRYLLKAAEDLEQRVQRVASGWETEFAISMDAMFSPISLSEDIKAFYAASGKTRLRFTQEVMSGTWEALLDRRADMLVGAAGDGPSGGGYVAVPMGRIGFTFVVAPTHPLAGLQRPLSKADLHGHRAIAVADSARKLPSRTVGLLFGQDNLTVPDMRSKHEFQRAGLGFGFLPEPCVRKAIAAGTLVAKEVEEPKPQETFYLAWRTGENGAALNWWRKQLSRNTVLERLSRATAEQYGA
ncbi:LysR substrate-binding domain-containing protein [Paralcaligenes sp. KSB-10]|uniref:LysR substrate-binding domain-containing protein n=1 Tax=Paralcaligenes sp. KSB-10 TaxID=2901142 RepID=UPI001E3863F1|nr:LysR substrate-binding domain-containing protein [Paralcaligenes sp. KSB-10]UHL64640.1 LysR substrate-binding domain-containing protein [Paralcaligenes sp. KSB-10]